MRKLRFPTNKTKTDITWAGPGEEGLGTRLGSPHSADTFVSTSQDGAVRIGDLRLPKLAISQLEGPRLLF